MLWYIPFCSFLFCDYFLLLFSRLWLCTSAWFSYVVIIFCIFLCCDYSILHIYLLCLFPSAYFSALIMPFWLFLSCDDCLQLSALLWLFSSHFFAVIIVVCLYLFFAYSFLLISVRWLRPFAYFHVCSLSYIPLSLPISSSDFSISIGFYFFGRHLYITGSLDISKLNTIT